jgi:hypothetical protein
MPTMGAPPHCRFLYLELRLGHMRREHARPHPRAGSRRYGGGAEEPSPVPVGVTGHRTQRPRGQVGPPGPHPADTSSPLEPGGERWPIPRPLVPLIAQLVVLRTAERAFGNTASASASPAPTSAAPAPNCAPAPQTPPRVAKHEAEAEGPADGRLSNSRSPREYLARTIPPESPGRIFFVDKMLLDPNNRCRRVVRHGTAALRTTPYAGKQK